MRINLNLTRLNSAIVENKNTRSKSPIRTNYSSLQNVSFKGYDKGKVQKYAINERDYLAREIGNIAN